MEGDGLETMAEYSANKAAAFFIDPPYTIAGKRLYRYSDIDHDGLFDLASHVSGNVLMTYDNVPEVVELAERYGFSACPIAMKNTHHSHQTELLIGRDLAWLS